MTAGDQQAGRGRSLRRREVLRWGAIVCAGLPAVSGVLAVCRSAARAAGATPGEVDPAVQKIYGAFVSKQIPGLPIDLVQAAKREGTLTFYHLASAAWPTLAEEFNRVFAGVVKVETFQMTAGQMIERFRSEESAGQHIADVMNSSDLSALQQFADGGYMVRYEITSSKHYPPAAKLEGYWYPVERTQIAAAWNTQKVTPAEASILATWDGLQRADVWGKHTVGFVNPAAGGMTSLPLFYLETTYGKAWWQRLAKYPKKLYNSIQPASDALAAGETDVIFFGSDLNFAQRWLKKAPVAWRCPRTSVFLPSGQFISRNAPHPNAAKLFQEFSFSAYAQSLMSDRDEINTYRDDVPDRHSFVHESWYQPPSGAPAAIDITAYGQRLPSLIQDWRQAFAGG